MRKSKSASEKFLKDLGEANEALLAALVGMDTSKPFKARKIERYRNHVLVAIRRILRAVEKLPCDAIDFKTANALEIAGVLTRGYFGLRRVNVDSRQRWVTQVFSSIERAQIDLVEVMDLIQNKIKIEKMMND